MDTKDFCSEISVIPQYGATCWFNAILIISFYSQMMRNLMKNKVAKTWKKNDNLFNFLKLVINNSYNTKDKKILSLFNKIKPTLLILKILNKFDLNALDFLKKRNTIGFTHDYVYFFLKYCNVNVLNITYIDNDTCLLNFYDNIYKIYTNDYNLNNEIEDEKETNKIIDKIPDVLVLYHNELTNYKLYYDEFLENGGNIDKYNYDNYDIKKEELENIKNYKDNINLFGNSYKLDGVLISSSDNEHIISGIHCNNNKYVYNGWNIPNTNLKSSVCPLFKHDWNLNDNTSFCLNSQECKMDFIEKEEMCFNFSKNNRVLIYVKCEEIESNELSLSKSNYSISNKEEIIKDYYDIDNLNNLYKNLFKEQIMINRTLSKDKIIKIVYLLSSIIEDTDEEKEFFTLLPISDFEKDEIIRINDKYYLLTNLFYFLFIMKLNMRYTSFKDTNNITDPLKKIIPIPIFKKIILNYFKSNNILEIYNKYFLTSFKFANFLMKINEEFIIIDRSSMRNIDKYKLIFIFVKLFGLEFLSSYLTSNNLNMNDFLLYLYNLNEDEKQIIVNKFNELNIITINNINELLKFMIDNEINDNIPANELIIIKNKHYNVILLYYYIIIFNNSYPIIISNVIDKILINFYNIVLLNSTILKKIFEIYENKKKELKNNNLLIYNSKGIYKLYKYKFGNNALNLETNKMEIIDFSNVKMTISNSIKGGKKKSLKIY
jgi:hypothetical protein